MDPTARFFVRLRKLAVTLESETAKLQEAFDNRNNEEDEDEITAKARRAFHEVNGDVGNVKEQIQGQAAQQRARVNEVSSFIKACRVMQQKVGQDIQTLKGHWENYGYQAPQDTHRDTKAKDQEAEGEVTDENEAESSAGGEGESQEEGEGGLSSSSPLPAPPPFTDLLRTPQPSDFGLCEIQMKRALAGGGWCAELPPMPEMSVPHTLLNTPAPPPMLLTPKRALRMDDDELQTPQMADFGISEHTMCLNNDFTMDLLRKNAEKPQRPPEDMPEPPVNALMESLNTKAMTLESPEPPVFSTPGLKITKTKGPGSPPEQSSDDPQSPRRPVNLPATPEVPVFLNPHLNKLFSTKKNAQQPVNMRADDDTHTFDHPSSPHGATGTKRPWEYDVPDISVMRVEDMPMPEMPKLETPFYRTRSAKMKKATLENKKVPDEHTVNILDLDGPTQEFSLRTPRIRMDYEEPVTPEMPDLSSVTQDICKLFPLSQRKRPPMAVVHPNTNRFLRLSEVSEREFQNLPKYLKQPIQLHNLNQAVHNINTFMEEKQGLHTELRMEELKKICSDPTKTPLYVLCLTELKRLEYLRGTRNMTVYKLCTHN